MTEQPVGEGQQLYQGPLSGLLTVKRTGWIWAIGSLVFYLLSIQLGSPTIGYTAGLIGGMGIGLIKIGGAYDG